MICNDLLLYCGCYVHGQRCCKHVIQVKPYVGQLAAGSALNLLYGSHSCCFAAAAEGAFGYGCFKVDVMKRLGLAPWGFSCI
jgi:hypothetical protein